MSSEVLLSNTIPFAGSGLVGYAMGFALKKIMKWMLLIVEREPPPALALEALIVIKSSNIINSGHVVKGIYREIPETNSALRISLEGNPPLCN